MERTLGGFGARAPYNPSYQVRLGVKAIALHGQFGLLAGMKSELVFFVYYARQPFNHASDFIADNLHSNSPPRRAGSARQP